MNITANITIDRQSIESLKKSILEETGKELKKKFYILRRTLLPRIEDLIKEAILTSPETESIISGTLRLQLGLENAPQVVEEIIEAVKRGIEIKTSEKNDEVTINILRSDYSDLLNLSAASYISESSGIEIPWLDWLLTQGSGPLVTGRFFLRGDFPHSRTGGAIMGIAKKNWRAWNIPVAFSGTAEDNWLTRALEGIEDKIAQILLEIVD